MERPQRGAMLSAFGSGGALRLARPPPPGIFCKSYQCHSMACLDREGLEFGDKIIVPQTAFREAHQLRLKLPLLFKVVNDDVKTRRILGTAGSLLCQFCGVLEFSAPDDQVFLPYWMMQSLLLVEGARVELRSILRPPAATFVRFKPHDDTFLDLAARQGPKALMEGALRRYSVLSEGATILVQHEGENFYLDTVEVRTFASSSASPNGEKNASSETTSEPTNVEGHVTRHSGNGNDERRDGIGNADNEDGGPLLASGGRRVRLVCLLGDLDLEVEFCAPHAPLPEHGGVKQFLEDHAAVQGEGLLAARIVDANDHNPNGHGSRSSMKDVSRSPDPSQPPACLVAGRHGEQPSSAFDRAAGPSGGRAEQQGLPWPLPAPARARKSCGEGDSASGVGPSRPRRTPGQLGIKPALPPPSLTAKCRAFSGKGASLLGEVARFPSDGKEGPDGGGGELPAAPAVRSTASSMMRSEGPAETGPQRWSVPVEACADGPRRLGEGAASETGGSRQARGRACGAGGSGAAAAVAEVDLDRRAEATPCVRCGRLVPTANLPLHELRCTSSRAARPPSSPPSGPPTTPDETTAASVAAPSASSRTEQPKAYTRGPGQPTAAAPSARLTCAFCGLVFRSAGPAAEHEQACGTRTERCDRCCGHVPRRDAESHRRPGGSCDAVIAAAEEHERLVLAAGRSLALNGCGSGGDGGGDGGGVTWRGEGGGLLGGRFDALLAEAVRSSKAASTALEDARVENYARLVEAGGVTPLAGTRGLVRSRPDGDHGRACSDRDCAGNHSEAGVEATAGATKGGSGTPDTLSVGLDTGHAGTGGKTYGGERATNQPPETPRSIAVSDDPGLRVGSRLAPDPYASPPSAPRAASSRADINASDDDGEFIPRELCSQSGSRERPSSPKRRWSWTCPRCTLVNPRESPSCEACGRVPSSTETVLKGTVSGGRRTQPSTNPAGNDDFTDSATAMGVVEGASPVAFTAPAEENLRKSPEQGVSAEPDGGLQATEEPGARAMDGSSRRRRQPAKTTPVLLSAAARAASLPDPSPPPLEIAIPSKERRFYAVRQTRHAAEEEAAAAAALQPSPVTTGSSENTRRASGSAPQTCRGRGPSADGISGTLEGGDTGHAVPTQARHTAPAASSNAPSAVGTREPLAEGGAAGVAGPRSRCLRSPAAFFPAGIHPPQSRRRKEAFALQGGTAVRHQQQQQQQQQQQYARTPQQAAPRKRAAVTKPHALTGRRRRLMGPPRRLGGIQRPSRLHHVPTSFPLAGSPPTETATVAAEQAAAAAAVLTPGSRPVREVLDRHDHRRHCREHSQESLRAVSPPAPTPSSRVALVRGGSGRGGTVSATRPPHASAAPASDISLSILGRNHGMGGNPRRTPVPGGGGARCGGAKTGEGSRRPGCGSDLAGSLKKEAGAGIGAWGKSYGVEKGEVGATAPAAAKAVATAVGVAPLKLRRRVNETRMLEPLVGR